MTNDPYRLFFEATAPIRESADWSTKTPTTDGCACCGRAWPDVEAPDESVWYQYGNNVSSKFAVEWQCLTCQSVRQPSNSALGIYRRNSRGEGYVYQSLSMMTGAGAVITTDGVLHLAVKPGHWKKLQDGYYAQNGQMHICSTMGLLFRLAKKGELGDIQRGIVVIDDFGRKADGLMRDLRQTTTWREVWLNSDNGPRCLNIDALEKIESQLASEGKEQAGRKAAFWRPVREAASGAFDAEKLKKWASDLEHPQALLACLPEDPKTRLRLHLELGGLNKAKGEA